MLQLPEDRRPPITPQLALRVAILGGIALAMFAIIFFRLWFLQVLSGDKYLAEANNNRIRDVKVPGAARGHRRPQRQRARGQPRVDRRAGRARRAAAAPGRERSALLPAPRRRSSAMKPRAMRRRRSRDAAQGSLPFATSTLKQRRRRTAVLLHARAPGHASRASTSQRVFLRHTRTRSSAAQLFGTVGEISREELKAVAFRGVQQGDRRRPGRHRVHLRPLPARPGRRHARPGRRARPAEAASSRRASRRQGKQPQAVDRPRPAEGRAAGHRGGRSATDGGNAAAAFVAMDPRNGEVLALGSSPTLRPERVRQAADAVALQAR